MVISIKNKFLFIHNPKAAGSSIRKILEKYGVSNPIKKKFIIRAMETSNHSKKFFYLAKKYYPNNHNFYGHSYWSEIKKELDKKTWDNLFKFGFVRNPYEKLLSAFNFIYSYQNRIEIENWAKENLKIHNSFESFVYGLENIEYKNKILNWDHFKPQHLFFCNEKNEIKVDFVGKLENVNKDFKYISKKLSIKDELQMINKSKIKNNYKKSYTEKMKKIVFKVYEKDFSIFDYKKDFKD